MTDVVAALIWEGDRFLACQRPAHKARGLLWEFVGGKVEPGETKQQALIRECQEELAVTIDPKEIFMELVHEYPDLTVRLTLFNAEITSGTPKMLEHHDIRWLRTDEIEHYDFCPADDEILKRLKLIQNALQARLFSMQDLAFCAFQSKLIPTVSPERIIGVRTPALRKLAKQLAAEGKAASLMEHLPHRFYEEDILLALYINEIRNFQKAVATLDAFLPYVDNWAVCDIFNPKTFSTRPTMLLDCIKRWIDDPHPYTVRFGVSMLMKFYLDEAFDAVYLDWVADIRREDYYIRMMVAWFFATALAKQQDSAINYLIEGRLDRWTHNKTIQKAIESYRITPDLKTYLRSLKRRAGEC